MPYMKKGKQRYSKKEKAAYYAAKSKVGAVSNEGEPLSDFQRGRMFERSQQLGQRCGNFNYRNADAAGKQKIREERRALREKQEVERKAYKARVKAAKKAAKGAK